MQADIEAEPKARGTLVAPVTPTESLLQGEFVEGYKEWIEYARRGWARSKTGKDWCDAR